MQIQARNSQTRHKAPLRQLKKAAATILSALGCPDSTELSISIVGDRSIHHLNRDYLGKDRPTNVISFSLQEGEFGHLSAALGDVVISADTAAREAEAGGISPWERMVFLLLHGILHLTGYDHERSGEAEARRMEKKEQELYALLQHSGLTTLTQGEGSGRRQ
jgi:probable rRNA maturation factor